MNKDDQIHASLNGELDSEQTEELYREILSDPESLTRFAELSWLNGQLQTMDDEVLSHSQSNYEKANPLPLWILFIAAGLIGAFISFLLVSPGKEFHPVATIIEAEGCQWAGSDLPTAKGSRLQAGRLALVSGMATLEFDSGATIVMEAPAILEVESNMRCRLIEGSLIADVPESAHGFTIDAPEMEVIDLGTRFGLTTNQFGKSHVMVFEGEVEVKRTGIPEKTNLKTGNTLVNGADLVVPEEEILRRVDLPLREGWTQVEAFKDTFVRFGSHQGNYGSAPLMMVKETDLSPTNRRRGIMSFDLSRLSNEEIETAEIFLDVESSGLGFSTLVPDSRFAIYGINDDSADTWIEHETTWDSLPGTNDQGPDPEKTIKLGTFEILRGASATTSVKMSSPELVSFLRKDANRIVTFLVVRETGEYESQGLVHAFATREHPTAKAPTLYFKLR